MNREEERDYQNENTHQLRIYLLAIPLDLEAYRLGEKYVVYELIGVHWTA